MNIIQKICHILLPPVFFLFILYYVNKNIITLDITDSYEKLLFLALRRKNTIAVLWILNYALVNNINLNINGKDEEGNYPVLSVLLYDFFGIILDLKINSNINDNTYNHLCDDYYIMSYIFIYSGKTNRILNLNDKNRNGDYPLLCACRNRRTNMVKMLIKYAEEHNIILNINDKNNNGQSPLSISVHSNSVEIVKTITDYAKKHNIILDIGINYIDNMIDINDGKKYELLIAAIESNKLEIVILLMQYICEYYYIYNNLNNQNVLSCSYILSYAINKNSTELVKIVIDYAKKCYDLYGTIDYLCNIKTSSILTAINNDNLEIVILVIKYIFNDSVSYCNDFFITQILSYAIVKDSTELVKLLLNYMNEFNLYSSIELAMETDKFEIIKLIIQYIIKNNINFDINHQYNCNEKLLTSATRKNNNKMVKTIIDYTTNIDKILNIVNRYDYSRHIPILQAVINDNFKMIKMIMKYIVENNVIFNPNYHENTNDNLISYALSKNDIELVIMIINYVNQNNITLDIAKYYDEDNLCSSIIYAMENDYIDMVTKMMEYSIDNNIVFNINYQVGSTGKYLLLYATFKNNIELVKKIIAYANQYNCILKIDDKDNFGNYPLYCCIKNNNTDMFRLIVDYSINKNIMPINMQNISSDKFMINYLIQYLFGVEDRYDQDNLVNKILKINKGNKRKFEMTQETQNKKVKKS